VKRPVPPEDESPLDTADMVADLTTVARGGLLNLAGVVANALSGFALVVVVTRGLGRTEAGIFFESVALFSILGAVAQWGADVGVVRAIPRYRLQGRTSDIPHTIRAGVFPALAIGGVAALAMFGFSAQLGRLLTNGAHGSDLAPALRVLAPFLPVYAAYMVGLAVTRGFGTMLPSTMIDKLGRAILQPILVAGGIALGLAGSGLAATWALPFALGLVGVIAWSGRLLRHSDRETIGHQEEARPLSAVMKEFWRFTGPRGLAGVFAVVVVWLDTLLIGALRSPAEAAAYAAATRFLVLGQFIGVAITQVVGPKLSELLAGRDRVRARAVYSTATWWLMGLAWPIYVSMIVLAPSLLSVFGAGYQQSRTALMILGAAMLVATAVGPVDVVLLMAGRSSWNLINTLVTVVANVGLNLWWIPRYGITGAAAAWAVSILLNNLLPLAEVWSLVRLQPFGGGSLVSGVSALVWFGGVGLAARGVFGDGIMTVLVTVIVGSVGHAAVLWRFRRLLHLEALGDALRRRSGSAPRTGAATEG
jgi:O-antigen/teichoic acid export membrane protein